MNLMLDQFYVLRVFILIINGFVHILNLCFLLTRKLLNQRRMHLTEIRFGPFRMITYEYADQGLETPVFSLLYVFIITLTKNEFVT
jgi:hypothetical protein